MPGTRGTGATVALDVGRKRGHPAGTITIYGPPTTPQTGRLIRGFLKGNNMRFSMLCTGVIVLAGCTSITEFLTTEQPPPKVPQMVTVICPANTCTGGINWVQVDLCYGRAVRSAESYTSPLASMNTNSNPTAAERVMQSNRNLSRERQRLNEQKAERADTRFETCLVDFGYAIAPCDNNATACRIQPSAAFIPLS